MKKIRSFTVTGTNSASCSNAAYTRVPGTFISGKVVFPYGATFSKPSINYIGNQARVYSGTFIFDPSINGGRVVNARFDWYGRPNQSSVWYLTYSGPTDLLVEVNCIVFD
jgi:hypothetical protein